ncbi:12641_t:CDS:2 [Cetraspora pellucida]|uniref:12641_t:CDS:1 n=1 Tax=Cetraspora pellucida TaxID=1433469 RepID=A0A9N9IKA9_9GLOM|nr:12641_t:CDS:2 [Cetraspora pellucida]
MPRVSLLEKAKHQLLSNEIVEGALTYLKATEGLLVRQLRRKDISEEDYKFRTNEITYFKNTIEQLNFKAKNLQNEINKLRKENKDLKKENKDLHEEMNNLSRNFGLIHLDENELLGRKKQEKINALHEIRKVFDLYKNKYKLDTIDAGPSKIVEIIEIEAGPSMIETKLEFEKFLIPEILSEIILSLSPSDISTLLRVSRSIKTLIEVHFEESQNFWRNYYFQFYKSLQRSEIKLLYNCKKCLHCKNELVDPVIIHELKIKICRQCIPFALIREFEETWLLNNQDLTSKEETIKETIIKEIHSENFSIKEEIIKAIHSVDFYQLQGFYLSFDLREDTERFMKEFNRIPIDKVKNWLKEKADIVNEYQKKILMVRNPLINDDNMEKILSNTSFSIPQEYTLSDNLDSIFSNFA